MKIDKDQKNLLTNVFKLVPMDKRGDDILEKLFDLLNISRKLNANFTSICCRRMTEKQEENMMKRNDILENKATFIAHSLGLVTYIQRDCRGYALYFAKLEDMPRGNVQKYLRENYPTCARPLG